MLIPKTNILILGLSFFLVQCSSVNSLKQGYFKIKPHPTTEKVDCIFSDNPFYSTADYTLFQCNKSPNDFYYVPGSLVVENDFNENPLVFSQFIKKAHINVVVKFSYEKEKFIEASTYLKSINAGYTLHILPINSINISNLTPFPDKGINYFGTASYAFFEGYVTFEIKGKNQVNSMRTLLLSAGGFQMIYQFKYLIDRGGILIQNISQIPIHINNINF